MKNRLHVKALSTFRRFTFMMCPESRRHVMRTKVLSRGPTGPGGGNHAANSSIPNRHLIICEYGQREARSLLAQMVAARECRP
jgi:hypothetical protein